MTTADECQPAPPAQCQPAQRPLRRDAEHNRRRIVQAAREVFATHGVSAGLNDIAHHAGLGVGTVYRRFPDKGPLIQAALQDEFEALADVMAQGLAADDAWDGLTFVLRRTAALHVASRGLRDVAFSSGHGQQHMEEVRHRFAPGMEELVERAQRQGSLRHDAVGGDFAMIMFMVTELAQHSLDVNPDAYQRYLTLFFDALRPQSAGSDLGTPLTDDETAAITRHWAEPDH